VYNTSTSSTSDPTMASKIAQFYSGRTVLLTGGSGFLGKQIIEKLLRSSPAIDQILVLIRTKKNKSPDDRLDQLFNSPVFDRLKMENPNFRRKVTAVPGDILLPGLGISDKDRSRIESNANVFIHSAASVSFTETLRSAVESNIKPGRKLLELAHASKSVDSFVYISTAYSQVDKRQIDEKIYDPPIDPYRLFNMIDVCDDEQLALLEPKLVAPRPNTYTFTKSVAEKLIDLERGNIPTAIVRPSIVTASCKEPFEGWVDNYTASNGIFAGAGMGTVRYMTGTRDALIDCIPIDIVVHTILAAGRHVAENKMHGSTFVVNSVSTTLNPCDSKTVCGNFSKNYSRYPTSKHIGIMPPQILMNQNWLMRNFNVYFTLPLKAHLIDAFLRITGRKPRAVKVQKQFTLLQEVLEFFTTIQFNFESKNVGVMLDDVTQKDKEEFNFDVRTVEWEPYLRDYWLGLRKYTIKDELAQTKSEAVKPTKATL